MSLKNPLHRYIIDYQGFNPLQPLNFFRYRPATSWLRPSFQMEPAQRLNDDDSPDNLR